MERKENEDQYRQKENKHQGGKVKPNHIIDHMWTVPTPHLEGRDPQTGSEKHDPTLGSPQEVHSKYEATNALKHRRRATANRTGVAPLTPQSNPEQNITRELGPFHERLLINQMNYHLKNFPTTDKHMATLKQEECSEAPGAGGTNPSRGAPCGQCSTSFLSSHSAWTTFPPSFLLQPLLY